MTSKKEQLRQYLDDNNNIDNICFLRTRILYSGMAIPFSSSLPNNFQTESYFFENETFYAYYE